ncbi:uncharacterized mitochondrial protein AtMg00810-like [Cannabis sativa]|uniref:uncharacterized mitochondrial protein AtMg00810-like n=1 Tax=Cannabis sativa TaxID=3483 RepID=UPI0029CA54FB|nr:uncharacterized mitochondrial protein AtMg00810-like [Cannabis sativa]
MVLIYVDDIIITGNDSKELMLFITKLNTAFELNDLGELHYFLGIEVFLDATGIYLSPGKFAADLLKRVEMTNIKASPTPITGGKPMSIHDGEELPDPSAYQSVIGAMPYVTHT